MVGSIPASVTMAHHLTVAAKQKNNKVCIVRTWHQATATGDCLMVVKPKNDNQKVCDRSTEFLTDFNLTSAH